jgi:hypothetical protein
MRNYVIAVVLNSLWHKPRILSGGSGLMSDLAQMRSGDHAEQCPTSEAKRKASTRDKHFAFSP